MATRDSFHDGEIAVQERTGERAVAARRGDMVRDRLVPPMQAFLAMQTTLAVGTTDDDGRLWASFWIGPRGFIRSDSNGVAVHVAHEVDRSSQDPVGRLLVPGRAVGMLAIDLATRRRVRVNGDVITKGREGFDVLVRESFPNCPKYIQRRELVQQPVPSNSSEPIYRGEVIDADRGAFIQRIDTLFVASRHPTSGVDVSHRGGGRGFVQIVDERTLRIPDYPGNSMFQTLGNFEVDGHAGVTMIDFEHRRMLAVTGSVAVTYGAEDPDDLTGGTGRYWQLEVERWIELPLPDGIAFQLDEPSPFNPPTTSDL